MKRIIKKKPTEQIEVAGKAASSLSSFDMQKVSTTHKKYSGRVKEWTKVRDCMDGEATVKAKRETYLPRPEGMSGKYAKAYDAYIERAHFPLICPYALQGALGVIITKLPDFNVPKDLEYILKTATKDGRSLQQLFIDIMIDIFQTGRVPIAVDVVEDLNEFRFVQYTAEDLINWRSSFQDSVKSILLAVLKEETDTDPDNIFDQNAFNVYRVLHLEKDEMDNDVYTVSIFGENNVNGFSRAVIPMYMGRTIDEIPLVMAGSINNSFNIQPIPLISVANCSVQIYRKEADLANSEFLSCNPTLVVTGAMADENLPNVVGSSVMIAIPNELAQVFYTKTDTAALTHVSNHIKDLYEEAIRHGVAILDARKGVEAAEALRIRQATQSASIYSIYLSALTALKKGLQLMCKWDGLNPDEVQVDAPTSLTFGIPDSALVKELIAGFADSGVIPIDILHKYLVSSGLLDQKVSLAEYLEMLITNKKVKEELGIKKESEEKEGMNPDDEEKEGVKTDDEDEEDNDSTKTPVKKTTKKPVKKSTKKTQKQDSPEEE